QLLEIIGLTHVATNEEQYERGHQAGVEHRAPSVGRKPVVDLTPDQRAEGAAGHHETQHLGAGGLVGEGFGEQWDANDDFRAGADTGQEATQAELQNVLRQPLRGREHGNDGDADKQRADPSDHVGDDPEKHAAERPAQQADHGQEAAPLADVGRGGISAEYLGYRRL